MRVKVNLSLDADTAEILKSLARESHKTVSQWVTDKVWNDKDLTLKITNGKESDGKIN